MINPKLGGSDLTMDPLHLRLLKSSQTMRCESSDIENMPTVKLLNRCNNCNQGFFILALIELHGLWVFICGLESRLDPKRLLETYMTCPA